MASDRGLITDSSIARMAGNIAAGICSRPEGVGVNLHYEDDLKWVAGTAVLLARMIASQIASEKQPGSVLICCKRQFLKAVSEVDAGL